MWYQHAYYHNSISNTVTNKIGVIHAAPNYILYKANIIYIDHVYLTDVLRDYIIMVNRRNNKLFELVIQSIVLDGLKS